MWQRVRSYEKTQSGEIRMKVDLPVDSNWFDGHFPDDPILPGIAQTGLVLDALKRTFGDDIAVSHLSRVKFKKKIAPGDRVTVTVKPHQTDNDRFSFDIELNHETACTGIITIVFESGHPNRPGKTG